MSELRNPLKAARGLGSAKDGTTHFANQRLTAIALVFTGLPTLDANATSAVALPVGTSRSTGPKTTPRGPSRRRLWARTA